MQDRITIKTLKARAAYLNKITNSPQEMWAPETDGSYTSNEGHWCISQAYGGYSLERVTSAGGATTCPMSTGHIKARPLYDIMTAFIRGIEFAQKEQQR